MRFEEHLWLHGLWVAPVLGALVLMLLARRGVALRRFASSPLLSVIGRRVSRGRQALRVVLVALAIALISVGLARPQWNATPRPTTSMGRDVCFIVDVSRSMLAEDLPPNRLERARLWIEDVLAVGEGDRMALVAFAGTAVVKCPLTRDYSFMRMAVEELDTDSVSRGGTLIGDAIRVALRDVFDLEEARHRDIILITDGEDHESFPLGAATEAGNAGIRLIAIGLGDENVGARIPITDPRGRRSYLTYEGKEVRTSLDSRMLEQLATATPGGRYLNVATGTVELDKVYRRLMEDAERSEIETRNAVRYDEKFQIFLGLALTLLLIEGLVSERRRGA
ncbi:MAG: VWA domain-containing protein [Phycisphaerales bacterium]|nr:VWA domain-containing protein [Phycisphaerales bacterium]